ncbi:alpha-1,3/1,6-mannosyltransferase ALG2 isoform X1 [Amphiprion ocellaris]|uniref:Alpha-1,3/1,6-mannosyltransferase ALG2 n=2 Tax=Amphiprion ocellaris TaxID=80972 RepID=A0A3Q1CM90_AMPOC|nr:alpha-1,3/1,6-mannosyltransferase ALG2 isoform X1 [Amphiprion ocellaris]XP_023139989.1 alpha-1,3/1,6-mannosyltransferase ALG2 isoform X1 [Amphiprion ocellaris]XP_054869728.1 alpha-1,3/1,6-mannosyltransferase ALG2 isoform X1 [Amphiprion ocellaris]XP_054869729.1 alpha-1,3/1,6-mannosyltransferase ALG2 isoform X1 [Amphiprion ocellaris]
MNATFNTRMVRVVFLHPDLGIGGAERLVVDAAVALKSQGCSVQIWTAHYDPTHCFSETLDPDLHVECVGDWLPTSVFGYLHALCAYLRMIYVAFYLVFLSGVEYDVIFCDQVSVCIPVLRLSRHRKKVLFYCHFPDQLLTQRKSALKKLYRAPIDWMEERTTGMADMILVNSQFTAGIFRETFRSLSGVQTDVLYPSLNTRTFDQLSAEAQGLEGLLPEGTSCLFLSLNRYERKKNLGLALEALAALRSSLPAGLSAGVHLVVAGGYDDRVTENVQHYAELKELAAQLHLEDCVTFLRSPSDSLKVALLRGSAAVLYTPSREHFGIVPVEAMYCCCPVIAVNSGGPLESVADGETGFLCEPTAEAFSGAMERLVRQPNLRRDMGQAGRKRVRDKFSLQAFSDQLYGCIVRLSQ